MSESFFDVADDAFWTDPRRLEPRLVKRAVTEGLLGTRVAAPRLVDLSRRETLPLLALHVANAAELRAAPFDGSALLVAVDPERNRVFAGPAVAPPDNVLPPRSGGAPPVKARSVRLFEIDLRRRLALPWRPAELLTTMILGGRVSNRVRTRLETGGYRDPEVERFLAERARKKSVVPSVPAGDLSRYDEKRRSPAMPSGIGIALASAGPTLHGSFRLPVRPDETLPSRRKNRPWRAARRLPTAIVGLTLLITPGERAMADRIHLRVPVYDRIDPAAESPLATGYFTAGIPVVGIRLVYALSGEVLEGPHSLAASGSPL